MQGGVEMGTARLRAAEESRKFRDGQSVKVVFRPEDVALSRDANLPEGCRRLSNGIIEEISFVGSYERLNVRLDLTQRVAADNEPPLYQVTINTPERMVGIPIIATRPKPEASATKFKVGERVAVGLTSFSVLPNYTLVGGRVNRTLDIQR
jgi:hypothetical protein